MTREMRLALLGPTTSRRNKMALLAECRRQGDDFVWAWEGTPYRSRLLLALDGGPLRPCLSFDEDVLPQMQDNRPPAP